jgi:hypothetical protein
MLSTGKLMWCSLWVKNFWLLSVRLFVRLSDFLFVSLPFSVSLSVLYVCLSVLLLAWFPVRPTTCPLFFLLQILPCNIPSRNPHPGQPNAGVVYSGLFLPQRTYVAFFPVFGKRLSMESNTAVLFPFDFNNAVQRPLQTLWSLLFLYDHEPSAASFAPWFKSLMIYCFRAASLSFWFYPLVLPAWAAIISPAYLSGLLKLTSPFNTASWIYRWRDQFV